MAYDTYIAWKRLTHNGRLSRDEMSAKSRAEYDALGISRVEQLSSVDVDEAKRLYEEATGRSRPSSDA